jgi:replicative DNA helicase
LTEQVLVLTAAQLNRPAASGVPSLENFRETGAIEQAVDLAVLLHPQEKESARAGEVDFIVGKQRDGETGTVALAAQLHLARFVDMAR